MADNVAKGRVCCCQDGFKGKTQEFMALGLVLIAISWLKMLFKHRSALQVNFMDVNFLYDTETYMKVILTSQVD